MKDIVVCHSETEYAERPVTLFWEGQELAVEDVLASWRTPEGKCFRVRTRDNQLFRLYYGEHGDEWHIEQD
ncbi:MAG: hypothetical protein AB1345_13425 [Chloroflexota bacterium]